MPSLILIAEDGDAMAALELGWPSDGHINIKPAVLEKSKQTALLRTG